MRTISGCGNWKLTYREQNREIVILRAVTCDRDAVLPDEIDGMPVVCLADRALSPNARPLEGEQVQITCGPSAEEWNNRNMESLVFPKSLRALENYALYNCVKLQTLHLTAGLTAMGTCVFMNCRSFRYIDLQVTDTDPARTIGFLAGELPSALELTVREKDGTSYRLMLPEYYEQYEENAAAHHFELNISGAGYPYHSVFEQGSMNFSEYDGFWDRYLSMEHNEESALKVAWYRLRTPRELGTKAEARYRSYLSGHRMETFELLLRENDEPGLRLLLTIPGIEDSTRSEMLLLSRSRGKTWATAILLGSTGGRTRPSGFSRSFDL